MSAQTGFTLPTLGGVKPVYAEIWPSPYLGNQLSELGNPMNTFDNLLITHRNPLNSIPSLQMFRWLFHVKLSQQPFPKVNFTPLLDDRIMPRSTE